MVAAADSHNDTSVGYNVGHGVVFRQPNWMPHRQDVKGAAKFQAFGLRGKPEAELDQVRENLVAFALEVMLGGPQHVEAEFVHELGDDTRRVKGFAQALVGIAAVIRRSAV